jgi:NAD(P)-dependent dehydrogenase (short-subunit alcohol dehydrogenase family)
MMTKALARNGASKVYISGRRKEVLEEAANQSPHGNIIPLVADVSSKEDIEALAEHIRNDVGHLNLLIANAGTWGPGPGQPLGTTLQEVRAEAMKTTMDEWDKCFRTNVHGCYYSIMAVLDLLDEGNKRMNYCNGEVKSQVIVTGSVGGYSRIVGGRNAYRASKAAVTHLAKCLSTGFQEFGIRVNTLAPGLFPSDLAAPLIEKYNESAGEDGKLDRKRLPEERIGAEEDITGTLLYLASRAGAYNNGNVCVLDGGLVSVMPASY